MKFFLFIAKHLRQNRIRTVSTVLTLALCIFLFCTMRTVLQTVDASLRTANDSRLVTRNAMGWIFNLPLASKKKIEAVPGVMRVSGVTWFGGVYKDLKSFFPNMAVDAEPYLAMHPEYLLSQESKKAFLDDRHGCIVSRRLAQKSAWNIGDTVQLQSFIAAYRTQTPFEFVIRGIYDTAAGGSDELMLFHFEYFYENTGERLGPTTYAAEIADGSQAGAISKAIDAQFENSGTQTRTETEAAFEASFISLAGNLSFLLNAVMLAGAFTVLLITANTISMAVRERRGEIAILKTLGFSNGLVMAMVLGEALLIGACAGLIGVLLSRELVGALPQFPLIGDLLRTSHSHGLSASVASAGIGVALLVTLLAGLVPALLAYRSRITDSLREV
jgi:putative ABC transport system permease protein